MVKEFGIDSHKYNVTFFAIFDFFVYLSPGAAVKYSLVFYIPINTSYKK